MNRSENDAIHPKVRSLNHPKHQQRLLVKLRNSHGRIYLHTHGPLTPGLADSHRTYVRQAFNRPITMTISQNLRPPATDLKTLDDEPSMRPPATTSKH